MNRPVLTSSLVLALLAAAPAVAQERSESPLRLARRTFAAADTDRNGTLDGREVRGAGIPDADFTAQDADGDGALSQDEFLVYYRRLLIGADRPTGDELDAEAERILATREARRRQEREERARREAAGGGAGGGADAAGGEKGDGSVADRLERAQRALDESVAKGELTPEQARQRRAEQVERAREAVREGDAQDGGDGSAQGAVGDRLDRARRMLDGRVEAGEQTRRGARGQELDQIERARAIARGGQAGEATGTPAPGSVAGRYERALADIRRARDAGQLSREEARQRELQLVERARAAAEEIEVGTPSEGTVAGKLERGIAEIRRAEGAGELTREQARERELTLIERARAAARPAPVPAPAGGEVAVDAQPVGTVPGRYDRALADIRRAQEAGDLSREEARRRELRLVERARAAAEESELGTPSEGTVAGKLERGIAEIRRAEGAGELTREQARERELKLIERARAAAQPAPVPAPAGDATALDERPAGSVAGRYDRALADIRRAQDAGEITREEARQRELQLVERARAAAVEAEAGAPSQGTVAGKLERGIAEIRRAEAAGTLTREQARERELQLIERARAAEAPSGGAAEAPAEGTPAGRLERARAEIRRAEAAGEITREEARRRELQLIERARSAAGGGEVPAPGAAEGGKSERLQQALKDLDAQLQSGAIDRAEYGRRRQALMKDAADATGREQPAPGPAAERERARQRAAEEQARLQREAQQRAEQQRRAQERQRAEQARREAERKAREQRARQGGNDGAGANGGRGNGGGRGGDGNGGRRGRGSDGGGERPLALRNGGGAGHTARSKLEPAAGGSGQGSGDRWATGGTYVC